MSDYQKNIFINCPFDPDYSPLLEALLFTLLICGLRPRCSLEIEDGQNRLDKIADIINECQFGFHDISRTELDPVNALPRFNMPLELGIFLGARKYGSSRNKKKVAIIFDRKKYRYQKYISDIAGIDIKHHDDDPKNLIRNLRAVLNANIGTALKGHQYIIAQYELYVERKADIIQSLELDDEPDFIDSINIITNFLNFLSSSALAK